MTIKFTKKLAIWIAIIAVFNLLLFSFSPNLILNLKMHLLPYTNKWYAVYLTNNQTFYGHIKAINSDLIKLRDVYYLSTIDISGQQSINLVKRGASEISLPENEFIINRSSLLYFEPMQENSEIVRLIRQHENK